MKKCSKCGEEKTVDSFLKTKKGYSKKCLNCSLESNKYSWKNQGIVLDHDQFKIMLASQQSRCSICGTHQTELDRVLAVDHNHITGKIRGLLCNKCNTIIGMCGEDVDILWNTIKYLEKYSD